METTITGLIVITVLLLAILTLSYSFLSAQDAVLESWQEMEERLGERARTDISPLEATTNPLGDIVEVTFKNEGDTKLADFDRWDVILQYGNGDVQWYPYGAGRSKWLEDIYLDASEGTGEIFDLNILNPKEEIVIQIWLPLTDTVPVGTHLATVATPNGISASTVFTH
jgi:hypothetical protein